ncbi:DUF7620 family protein [Sphaerisporangium aureirubrum]|uniref:Uncharacterized protein n=1 Tax=Sphaerisporangium aureirubrum TaxID=1544736 RepID=A0ABW1NCV0_9ACTN
MTGDEQDRPDLDQARHLVDESRLRAQRDMRAAKEKARHKRSLAQRLRELREENGFDRVLDDAFGGGSG